MQKKLTDQFFQGIQMLLETVFAQFGNFIFRIGLSTNELLFRLNVINILQRFQMACQIAVGNFQQLFHRIEIRVFVDRQDRHDSKPDTAIENLI
jgi:hypothetical protein